MTEVTADVNTTPNIISQGCRSRFAIWNPLVFAQRAEMWGGMEHANEAKETKEKID